MHTWKERGREGGGGERKRGNDPIIAKETKRQKDRKTMTIKEMEGFVNVYIYIERDTHIPARALPFLKVSSVSFTCIQFAQDLGLQMGIAKATLNAPNCAGI